MAIHRDCLTLLSITGQYYSAPSPATDRQCDVSKVREKGQAPAREQQHYARDQEEEYYVTRHNTQESLGYTV